MFSDDPLILVYLILAGLFAIGVGAVLFRLGVHYAVVGIRKRRTRKLIRGFADHDARRRVLRGVPTDRDDLHGDALIDALHARYDWMQPVKPVRKR